MTGALPVMRELIQIVVGGLFQGCVFALVAVGYALVYRVSGVINLAQGAFCSFAAMMMYTAQVDWGLPVIFAALITILATVAVSVVVGQLSFVPALGRLPASGMLMLTAGLLTFFEGLILLVWGSRPYALPPVFEQQHIVVAGVRISSQGLVVGCVTLVVGLAFWLLLTRTTTGRALRACSENPLAARLMGIDVKKMASLSFAMAALVGAVGGIAIAPLISFEFDTGRFFTLSGFIAVAIGGMGSFIGGVVGALLLGVTSQLIAAYGSWLLSNVVPLLLLLAILVLKPNGLFSSGVLLRRDAREDNRVHAPPIRSLRWPVLACGAAVFVGLLALPLVIPGSSMISSLVIVGILFCGVLGLDLLMGYAGQVNLGQAGFLALGGYAAAILATRYGLSPLTGTLCAMLISVLVSLVLAALTIRLRGVYLALATLAFGLLAEALAIGLDDLTGGPSGLIGIPSFAIGTFEFGTPESMYYLVLAIATACVLLVAGLVRSRFGRALLAIRTDQTVAASLGINVVRYKMAALAICAALGSLSGSLYAFFFNFLSPEMVGTSRSFEMIAMMVLGGERTLVGPVIGVAILSLFPALVQALALYKTMVEGALLAFLFRYLPQGLLGTGLQWAGRRAAQSTPDNAARNAEMQGVT
jgi:branched-chain amino acid transport system permease protein